MAPQKYFPLKFWTIFRKVPETVLHLIDDNGQPVDPDVRGAIEKAFRRAVRQFPRIDEAILADMAEEVALRIAKNRNKVRSIQQYAFVAMDGRAREWFRRHPGLEVQMFETAELESVAGGEEDSAFDVIELKYLFEQMKTQLSQRDRQILALIEQGCGSPKEVAAALGITYTAAAKAVQRAKDHVAEILSNHAVHLRRLRKASE